MVCAPAEALREAMRRPYLGEAHFRARRPFEARVDLAKKRVLGLKPVEGMQPLVLMIVIDRKIERLLDRWASWVHSRGQVLHGLPSVGTGWVELTVFEGCFVR